MPSLETPPKSAPPNPPVKVRTNRYGVLEEHELIHLLDALDDERARARFRESVYISIIIWLAIGWFVLYGPQVIFHQPRLINPADVLKQRDKELTFLDMPKDVSKQLQKKPTNVLSDKDRTQQAVKPTLDRKTLEQLQAMRKAGPPDSAPTPPAPQPQQAAPAPQQQQPAVPQPVAQQHHTPPPNPYTPTPPPNGYTAVPPSNPGYQPQGTQGSGLPPASRPGNGYPASPEHRGSLPSRAVPVPEDPDDEVDVPPFMRR